MCVKGLSKRCAKQNCVCTRCRRTPSATASTDVNPDNVNAEVSALASRAPSPVVGSLNTISPPAIRRVGYFRIFVLVWVYVWYLDARGVKHVRCVLMMHV